MMPVLTFVVQGVVTVLATAWVLRRDMRRLDPERYRRAWSTASFWSAVVYFAPLCIPVHFVRTRRSVWGALLGLLWGAAVAVAAFAAAWLVESAAAAVS